MFFHQIEGVPAVLAWHVEIEQHELGRRRHESPHAVATTVGAIDLEALRLQGLRQGLRNGCVIIDQ